MSARSQPNALRQMNQRRIVRTVMRHRSVSRAQLARLTGMSPPTVGRIVDELLAAAIVSEADTASMSRVTDDSSGPVVATAVLGRPSRFVELESAVARFLAVQVGVRTTRLARAPYAAPQTDCFETEFPTPKTAISWAARVEQAVAKLPLARLDALVISLPGIIDEAAGRVLLSPNLHWTTRCDLARLLAPVLGDSTRLLFVQEIAALAVGHVATQPEATDFLLVDFGHGIGAAAVAGGKLLSTPLPVRGELGHTPVVGNTRPCGCGNVGCVETLASRGGLLQSAGANHGINDWPAFVRFLTDTPTPAWLKRTLDAIAAAIVTTMNTAGLPALVLTGFVRDLPPVVTEYLAQSVHAGLLWSRLGDVSVTIAPRHRLAGMVETAVTRTLLED